MKIDFTSKITDLAGDPIREGDRELTLGSLSVNALLAPLNGPNGQPEQLDGEAHCRHATLAQAIFLTPADIDLKAEDVVLLKERIARSYSSLAVMRAWELLDPKERG